MSVPVPSDFPTCILQGCTTGMPHRHGTDGPYVIAPVSIAPAAERPNPYADDPTNYSGSATWMVESAADVIARDHRVMHTSHAAEIVCLCGQTFAATTGIQAIPITAAVRYGHHLAKMREQYDSREGF